MERYIAFLRGINVSGKNKIEMTSLKECLSSIGLLDVKTYIQSGNVLFLSKETDIKKLELLIEKQIKKCFNFIIEIIVISPKDLINIRDNNPFSKLNNETKNYYFIFLKSIPSKESIEISKEINIPGEPFYLEKNVIYISPTVGYGNSKLNNNFFEKRLKVSATTRNLNTISKLIELSMD